MSLFINQEMISTILIACQPRGQSTLIAVITDLFGSSPLSMSCLDLDLGK